MKAKTTGFSLLEVMVVVAVLGVLSTLSGPSLYAAMRHRAMDRLARAVSSNIYTARSKAIIRHKIYSVRLGPSATWVEETQTGTRFSRYPSDPKISYDSAWTISQSDWLGFNGSGLLIDGNETPNSQVVVTFTDTITGDVITLTVNNAGSVQMNSGA